MIKKKNNKDLSKLNTFGMKVRAACYLEYDNPSDLASMPWDELAKPLLQIGSGSNLLFCSDFPGTVMRSRIDFFELLQERSIGDRLPQAFIQEVTSRFTAITSGGLVMFIVEILILYAVVCASLLLVQGVRKIPVQYAKRLVGNKQYGGARQYVPLKLFAANVMPIIFAQALMFIPLTLVQYSSDSTSTVLRMLMDHKSLLYNVIFAALIIAFTYFYTAITLNPTQMAEDMKRNNGFIPGIKPGKDTADYIDTVMSRLTGPGSLFIAFIAIMPALAGLLNVQDGFAQFFGGTSLLILVGVVIDTLQQIESHLMMRHYDGLLNSGRVRGRNVAAY